MIRFIKKEKPLATVVAVALLVRLAYCFLLFPVVGEALHWRGVDDRYDELARNMLNGHGYVTTPGRPPNLLTPPGYAFFLSGLYAVAGAELGEGPRLWVTQAALDALSCGILYALGALLLGDRRAGLFASVAWALYPQIIVYSARIAPEILFTLLFIGLFAAWTGLELRGGAARALAAGAVWGALVLTKEKMLLLPLLLLLRLWWVRRARPRRFGREGAAFVLAGLVVISPWLYRGYRLTGGVVPITLRGGRALAEGMEKDFTRSDTYLLDDFDRLDPQADSMKARQPLGDGERDASTRALTDREASRLRRALGAIAASPATFLRSALERAVAYWYWGQPRVIFGNAIINLPLLALGILGLRRAWSTPPAAVATLLVLYMNGIHAVTVVRMRYALPVMPLIVLFAAYLAAGGRRPSDGAGAVPTPRDGA